MGDTIKREDALIYVFERMKAVMENVEDKNVLEELKLLTSYLLATIISVPTEGL